MKHLFLHAIIVLSFLSIMSCKDKNKAHYDQPLRQSELKVDTILSSSLNEHRFITVYLPKGYTKKKQYSVIYCTDGQEIVDFYKNDLDSIISHDIIPECILVGVHSNEKAINNTQFSYRQCEYIQKWSKKWASSDSLLKHRFDDHFDFFTKELISYVENKYSVSNKREYRFFYGVSNGAGFGITLGTKRPDLFSVFLCYSQGGGEYEGIKWEDPNIPFYYLSYGNEEPLPFIMVNQEFDKFLTKYNYPHSLYVYEGGHDRNKWKEVFLNTLSKIIKKPTVHNIVYK